MVRSEFFDGVINSDERMTYTAVNGILTDRDPELMKRYEPLVPNFELMRELFQILNDARRRRGSIVKLAARASARSSSRSELSGSSLNGFCPSRIPARTAVNSNRAHQSKISASSRTQMGGAGSGVT